MNHEEYDQMYHLEDKHWWFVARRKLVNRALHRFPPPIPEGRPRGILDLGCGTGGTLDWLRHHGTVFGVDLEPSALQFCRKRGYTNLALASATALPFADATFEAIVTLDVLEHIPDHSAAAREIARTLVPGGHVYVTVPAYQSLWSSHDVALMHQRRYVAPEIKGLLTGAGLEIVHLTYTVSAYLPLAWGVRTFRKRLRPNDTARTDIVPTNPLLNTMLRGYLEMEGAAALKAPAPFGLTVFAVARRPMGP